MAKKNYYGDPRIMDTDFFATELVVDEKYMSQEDLLKLYDESDIQVPVEGKVVTLTYVGISGVDFAFDGSFKDYVRMENKPSESKYLVNTNIGDKVDILITKVNNTSYEINGSLSELYESKARKSLTNLKGGVSVMAYIKELTPAGYTVDISYESVTLPGFMPNTLAGINKLSSPNAIVGQTFNVMIESFSQEEGTYIVSRRKYLQTLIPLAIKELKNNVVYTGIVTGTTQFGVFVEFKECLTGMIHKTNLNPELVDRIDEILPGYEIDFFIKEIIKDKIILTQVLRESLWDSIKIGQTIKGIVKDTKSFGVLIGLDGETNGLIHISELEKSSKKLEQGSEIKVKVIAVDRMNRKIFLTVAN
jgi:ribosomal protein S1